MWHTAYQHNKDREQLKWSSEEKRKEKIKA